MRRKPSWLKVRSPAAGAFRATGAVFDELGLHTVCREARCPNKGECFSAGTATFLILGDVCSRNCRFCAVGHAGGPPSEGERRSEPPGHPAEDGSVGLCTPDPDEPARLAEAALRLGLKHVVVTSVTRDDLGDGGAAQFAAAIRAVHEVMPAATVEVLVPDFAGERAALDVVLAARPEVLAHNLETVPRLYARVRPQAVYARSLELLQRAAAAEPRSVVKTGLMLGLGERTDEVLDVLADCVREGVDVVTVGQYLQPEATCLPVARYVEPDEFAALEAAGAALGIRVVAGPFVRSSYRAADVVPAPDGAA